MKTKEVDSTRKPSFLSIILSSILIQIVFILPIIPLLFFTSYINLSMLIIFLLLSIIFILVNSIGVIVLLPKGKPIRNYLLDASISYGGTMGLIFGFLAAISQASTSVKILVLIISSIWGIISGIIGSFWIKNQSQN